MLDLDDNTLIALSLREHAQTCEDIAAKHTVGSEGRTVWNSRAERCRVLARRYENVKSIPNPERGQA